MLDVNVRRFAFLLSAGALVVTALSTSACGGDLTAVSIAVGAGEAGAPSVVATCDEGLELDAFEANEAARALDLCHLAEDDSGGLLSARYAQADGSEQRQTIGHGLLTHFGASVEPRQGASFLALSTGAARNRGDEFAFSPFGDTSGTTCGSPVGFPSWPEACRPFVTATPALDPFVYDSSALELVIRVPADARSLSFDFSFFASDFPTRTCSPSNDVFAVLVEPPPPGAKGRNVVFDGRGDPISVNSDLLQVCLAQNDAQGTFAPCQLGPGELEGTYYEDGAATGWLSTRLPVVPGSEISVFFTVWDAEDYDHDSLVLLDRLTFHREGIAEPVTLPVADVE
jgi:hypothetical protein